MVACLSETDQIVVVEVDEGGFLAGGKQHQHLRGDEVSGAVVGSAALEATVFSKDIRHAVINKHQLCSVSAKHDIIGVNISVYDIVAVQNAKLSQK
jgi:hypothetical protein